VAVFLSIAAFEFFAETLHVHTSFTGPLKVFDVSNNLNGRSVTIDVFKDKINPGNVVLIYTNYDFKLYNSSESIPESITLTYEAAEYLASIPV